MCHLALTSGSQPTGWWPPLSPGHSWQSDDRGSEVPGPLPPLHPSQYFARSFMRHFIHVPCGVRYGRVAQAVMVCRWLCSVVFLLGVLHDCKYHLTDTAVCLPSLRAPTRNSASCVTWNANVVVVTISYRDARDVCRGCWQYLQVMSLQICC